MIRLGLILALAVAMGPLATGAIADCFSHLWSISRGSPQNDLAFGVTRTSDGSVWIAGGAAPDTVSVYKFGSDGSPLLNLKYRVGGTGYGIAAAPDGGVFVTGFVPGSADFGGGLLPTMGSGNIFLLRLAADGTHVWSRLLGYSSGTMRAYAAASTANGDVLVGGSDRYSEPVYDTYGISAWAGKFSGNSALLWQVGYGFQFTFVSDCAAITEAPNGDVVVAATIERDPAPPDGAKTTDALLGRISPTGVGMWSKMFGSPLERDFGSGISVAPDGSLYLAGIFRGTMDFGGTRIESPVVHSNFVAKLTPDGNHLWSRALGLTGATESFTGPVAAATADGGVLVAANFSGTANLEGGTVTSAGNHDILLASLDPSGQTRCIQRLGGPGNDVVLDMNLGADGRLALTGIFTQPTDFGGGLLPHEGGGHDAFVLMLGDAVTSTHSLSWIGSDWVPDGVRLAWYAPGPEPVTATLSRRIPDGARTEVATVTGVGRLEHIDRTVVPGTRYGYSLTSDAGQPVGEEVWIDVPQGPVLEIRGIHPNPARAHAFVEFSLPRSAEGTLLLVDVAGRTLRSLDLSSLGPGAHRLELTSSGMPAGIYFVRLSHGGQSLSRRCVFVR